jgi:ribosomal-protein-alanine N-acetyltransferase
VIRLVPATVDLLDAALAGDRALASTLGHTVIPGWATFTGALQRTRDALAAASSDTSWRPRLFVAEGPPELVGWGGFKGPRATASMSSATRSPRPAASEGSPPLPS